MKHIKELIFVLVLALAIYVPMAGQVKAAKPDIPNLLVRIAVLEQLVAQLHADFQAADAGLAARVTTLETGISNEATARIDGDEGLESRCTTLETGLSNEATARIDGDANLQAQIDTAAVPQSLLDLAPYVSVDQTTLEDLAGPHIIFEGANVHVRNTLESTYSIDGLGNLIVGYNENAIGDDIRSGSHNIVVGTRHTYTSYGGLVAGWDNAIIGEQCSVVGGSQNTASDRYSSVSGGLENEASGQNSSVSGDVGHIASGFHENYEAIPVPDYDSGWIALCPGCSQSLEHNLGGDPDDYIVDFQFDADSSLYGLNTIGHGFFRDYGDDRSSGATWKQLDDEEIHIERGLDDLMANHVRVRIWIID